MSSRNDSSIWIYTDADNTLWDTDSVFADAQLEMLSSAELIAGRAARQEGRLEYLRSYDQAIAKRHHSKLRYPPALLIRALALGLHGVPADVAATKVIASGAIPDATEESAISKYQTSLARTPPLLPGVLDGLEDAASHDTPVYIVTEGSVDSARKRTKDLAIESFISGFLSAVKSPELFFRLKERAAPRQAVMIGDQPDRDIRPAQSAGLGTVLIRSRFRPAWHSENDAALADVIVDRFDSAITWILNHSEILQSRD
jgi:putative hydrolase of the HAD superfamily